MFYLKKIIFFGLFCLFSGVPSTAVGTEGEHEKQVMSEGRKTELNDLGKRLISEEDDGYFLLQFVANDPKNALLKALEAQKIVPGNLGWYYVVTMVYASDSFKAKTMDPLQRKEHFLKVLSYLNESRTNLEKALHSSKFVEEKEGLRMMENDINMYIAWVSVETGDLKEAKRLAEEGLKKMVGEDGNTINSANTILGRVALRKGDIGKAKKYLQRSAQTSGSPQLNSFGPTFLLAHELLEHGEKNAVLDYLDRISLFWIQPSDRMAKEKRKLIAKWKKLIQHGDVPDDPRW